MKTGVRALPSQEGPAVQRPQGRQEGDFPSPGRKPSGKRHFYWAGTQEVHSAALPLGRGARGGLGFFVKHHDYGRVVPTDSEEASSGRSNPEPSQIRLAVGGGVEPTSTAVFIA